VTATRRRKPPARSARRRAAPTRDFWGGEQGEPDAPGLIRPSDDPTAMIRSLGAPPFPGGETIAEHYFAAVYQKAATLATALAAASGLLDDTDNDTNNDTDEGAD
jgi:hypothetical protein